jgi:hypothetical protein
MMNRSSLLGIAKKLLFRPKIIGSLIVAVILCYQVGVEMVVKGQMEAVKKIDDTITSKTGDMEKQKELVKRYSSLSESIKILPLHLAELAKGESPKVKAASLASQIQALIPQRGPSAPQAEGEPSNGSSPPGAVPSAALSTANPSAPAAASSDKVEPLTLLDIKAKEPITQDVLASSFPAALQPKLEGQVTSLKLWEFPYSLQLEGSTLELVAFLNALVQMEPVVVITSVELKLDDKATPFLKYAHALEGNGLSPAASAPTTGQAATGSDITVPTASSPNSTTSSSVIAAGDKTLDRSRNQGVTATNTPSSVPLSPRPTMTQGKAMPLQFGAFAPGTEGGKIVPPKIEFKLPDVSLKPSTAKPAQGAPVVMLLEISLFIQDKTLNP